MIPNFSDFPEFYFSHLLPSTTQSRSSQTPSQSVPVLEDRNPPLSSRLIHSEEPNRNNPTTPPSSSNQTLLSTTTSRKKKVEKPIVILKSVSNRFFFNIFNSGITINKQIFTEIFLDDPLSNIHYLFFSKTHGTIDQFDEKYSVKGYNIYRKLHEFSSWKESELGKWPHSETPFLGVDILLGVVSRVFMENKEYFENILEDIHAEYPQILRDLFSRMDLLHKTYTISASRNSIDLHSRIERYITDQPKRKKRALPTEQEKKEKVTTKRRKKLSHFPESEQMDTDGLDKQLSALVTKVFPELKHPTTSPSIARREGAGHSDIAMLHLRELFGSLIFRVYGYSLSISKDSLINCFGESRFTSIRSIFCSKTHGQLEDHESFNIYPKLAVFTHWKHNELGRWHAEISFLGMDLLLVILTEIAGKNPDQFLHLIDEINAEHPEITPELVSRLGFLVDRHLLPRSEHMDWIRNTLSKKTNIIEESSSTAEENVQSLLEALTDWELPVLPNEESTTTTPSHQSSGPF